MRSKKLKPFREYKHAKKAIKLVCQDCDYWDEDSGTCMEGINLAMCDCQFTENMIIPEFVSQKELDEEPDND